VIKRVPKPELIVEITHDLSSQARQGIKIRDRFPSLAVVGVINGHPISKSGKKPAVMNFEKNLRETSTHLQVLSKNPKTFKGRILLWWMTHADPMLATFGGATIRDKEDKGKSKQDDGGMIDL
jgi:hypothetical protein